MQRNLPKLKQFVEQIHRSSFYQIQPSWMPDTQLDLYCPHLKKAYIITDKHDDPRVLMCEKHGVKAVVVPAGFNVM